MSATGPTAKAIFLSFPHPRRRCSGIVLMRFLGRRIANFYKDLSRRDDFIELLQRDGRVDNFEAEIRKKDGTFVWVSTNAKAITDAAGSFCGVEGITRDISQLKKVEEEKFRLQEGLRQSQKMEAVGTLAGGIAHDFNNILSAVIGYTELVIDRLPEGSQDKEDLKSVLAAALRGKEMTNQILMFSRKRKPDKGLIQASSVVEEAVRLLQKTIPASVKINVDIDHHAGFLLADPTQIHQVVFNLCTNAYHSLENEKGEINIQFKPVKVEDISEAKHLNLPEGDYALLTVTDTGRGIDKHRPCLVFLNLFSLPKIKAGEPGWGCPWSMELFRTTRVQLILPARLGWEVHSGYFFRLPMMNASRPLYRNSSRVVGLKIFSS